MRTTITLDRDVASKAKAARTKTGKTFKQVINEALRTGLEQFGRPRARKPYRTQPLAAGLQPGIDLSNVGELLEQLEGKDSR